MKWQHCHALNNERADKHLLQPKMVDQIVVCLILSIVRSLLSLRCNNEICKILIEVSKTF